jgi:peptide chain release factor subunit 1
VGITNGERIEVLWNDRSMVQGKHKAGGQSAQRFERGRNEALKHWLRKVRDVVISYGDDRELIIGGPGMTKEKFIKELPGYVAESIIEVKSVGYTDENGLWELIGSSRYI